MNEDIQTLQSQNLTKYKVIVFNSQNISKQDIATQLGIDRKQVYRIIEKFEKYGTVEINLRVNNGKKSIFDENDQSEIKNMIQSEGLNTFLSIKERIISELGKEASDSTIRRVLQDIGNFILPSWSPILTINHIKQRLQFCQYHINHKTSFKHVIFTDESRFYVNRNTRKVFTLLDERKPQKMKFNPDFSIMVWGAISYEGALYLQVIEGRLNSDKYLQLLENFFNEQEADYGNTRKWHFQQDGAPAHKPQRVKDNIQQNGLAIHIHPPNSPDLNPIEKIWGQMKIFVEKQQITNKQQLEDSIFDAWNSLSQISIRNSIDQLKTQIKLVVDENGYIPSQISK